jgi:hypothetical protein
VKRQKRGLETVDDDAVDVLGVQPHLGVTEPKLLGDGRVGDQPIVRVDRDSQPQIEIELQRVAA